MNKKKRIQHVKWKHLFWSSIWTPVWRVKTSPSSFSSSSCLHSAEWFQLGFNQNILQENCVFLCPFSTKTSLNFLRNIFQMGHNYCACCFSTYTSHSTLRNSIFPSTCLIQRNKSVSDRKRDEPFSIRREQSSWTHLNSRCNSCSFQWSSEASEAFSYNANAHTSAAIMR